MELPDGRLITIRNGRIFLAGQFIGFLQEESFCVPIPIVLGQTQFAQLAYVGFDGVTVTATWGNATCTIFSVDPDDDGTIDSNNVGLSCLPVC